MNLTQYVPFASKAYSFAARTLLHFCRPAVPKLTIASAARQALQLRSHTGFGPGSFGPQSASAQWARPAGSRVRHHHVAVRPHAAAARPEIG